MDENSLSVSPTSDPQIQENIPKSERKSTRPRVAPGHRETNVPIRLLQDLFRLILVSPVGSLALGLVKKLFSPGLENWVDIVSVRLALPQIAPEFDGYRIVQISDFHIGTWLTGQGLAEAVELVNHQEPDLVAITGDFVTYDPHRYVDEISQALAQLAPKDASVAILGNHDHWTDPDLIRSGLRAAGILDLSNRVYTLRRGQAQLHIAGVDCHYDGLDRLEDVLAALPTDGAAVLLAHEPDFAEISAASHRFGLQISGHSHGGQIRLPFIGPPFLPRHGRKYPAGLYRVNGMYQYTNRGLGTAELAVRWNCRPEITVFTLVQG